MTRIVINAIIAKKNSGGAFQISSNFILESIAHSDIEWYWIVSSDLDSIIGEKFKAYKNKRYFVFPTQPDFLHTYFRVRKELGRLEKEINPDLVYSITAPSYFKFTTLEVMRFTNPYVTHLNKYAWSLVPTRRKVRNLFYLAFQKRLIRNTRYFVTQSQTCKDGLVKITGVNENHVQVVSNVLPAAFRSANTTHIQTKERWVNIACIGAPFFHKNFSILPFVLNELQRMGYDNVRFHVTIPKDHPLYIGMLNRLQDFGLPGRIITHGRCSQIELVNIYRLCHLCYQPTTLEVFSASAVEAMFFHLPTVATDLPFNRSVFADSCLYYEPCNAYNAALQFVRLINNEKLQTELCKRMEKRLDLYGDYGTHFSSTKSFLLKVANNQL